jgi:hypothetical protein
LSDVSFAMVSPSACRAWYDPSSAGVKRSSETRSSEP